MKAKLALLCFFLFASQAFADAEISEIKIGLDGDRVLTTFTLTGAFDQRFSERVDSGLPTAILYRLELFRDRKRWWDRHLRESTFEVVATYDAVARAYTVHYKLNDKLIESRTVRERKSLEEPPRLLGGRSPPRVAAAGEGPGRARLADHPVPHPGHHQHRLEGVAQVPTPGRPLGR